MSSLFDREGRGRIVLLQYIDAMTIGLHAKIAAFLNFRFNLRLIYAVHLPLFCESCRSMWCRCHFTHRAIDSYGNPAGKAGGIGYW